MAKLRKHTRLPVYDYSTPGRYFVTMCTDFMQSIFGDITDGSMRLNEFGTIAHNCWEEVPTHFPEAELDFFQVMPNHVHAILLLGDRSHKLGHIIGSYKAAVTKRIHELPGNSGITVWERSFYDHIIRDEDSLRQIRRYITNNPLKWELDRYHPTRQGDEATDDWLDVLGEE